MTLFPGKSSIPYFSEKKLNRVEVCYKQFEKLILWLTSIRNSWESKNKTGSAQVGGPVTRVALREMKLSILSRIKRSQEKINSINRGTYRTSSFQ